MATAEGTFPKVTGDVNYASEADDKVGNFLTVTAGENITAGEIVFLKKTDGKAYVSDTGTADDIRANGIAHTTGTTGNDVVVQIRGGYTTSGLSANDAYYLGASGALSTTESGVLVGYAYSTTILNINIIQDDRDAVGTVKAYFADFTGVPSNNLTAFWQLCDGTTISDAESLMNGQTVPDLNADARFLRGADTSGGTGGAETINIEHNHSIAAPSQAQANSGVLGHPGSTGNSLSTTQSVLPKYYNTLWMIKKK